MMENVTIATAIEKIRQAANVTFLTGAGVSTPSGVPDYRSLTGIYHGIEAPEYLLSRSCLVNEPAKFYAFVKKIYHPKAEPNVIHQVMAALSHKDQAAVVSQNIDGLHQKAGTSNLVDFHGTLYHCYCQRCGQSVSWQDYLKSDRHEECGGQIRPDIVLYEEGFAQETLERAAQAVFQAELLVIVGTSFQVHPFCDLIFEKKPQAEILVINQTPIYLPLDYAFVQADGSAVFRQLKEDK